MPDSLPAAVGASLREGLAALGLNAALDASLLAYLALMQRWNRAYNLTAIRDPQAMVALHLLDSLALLPHVSAVRTLADLGTGAGLPGIPLALARPQMQVTLVEANGKKARFLREVVRVLQLDNVEIIPQRIERVAAAGRFDAITARALASLAHLLALGGHLLAGNGRVLALKGALPAAEMADLPAGWEVQAVHRLHVPGLEAARHLVVLVRAGQEQRSNLPA